MPQAFDAQSPPFDRLTHAEMNELRSAMDIGYWSPGEVIVSSGQASQFLHVVIKGAVEERDGDDVEVILRAKDCFDARALVQGAAGTTFIAAEETLCYLLPKDVIVTLIQRNPGFAAFFYSELSRKLSDYSDQHDDATGGVNRVLRARVNETRLHDAIFIDGDATIQQAAAMMEEFHNNTLFVTDTAHVEGTRVGIITGTNLSKAAVLNAMPLNTKVSDVAHFEIFATDAEDFIFEALIKMTRHRVRRLAVTQNGKYIGTLEDIDILGLVAGNSQLIPGRIDRARTIDDLALPARDIQEQVERLNRQRVQVDVIAEITSDLNRALFAKVFDLIAPASIKDAGCLIVMGSEGRGEQTIRTDQDNGLLLATEVPQADLDHFRAEFTAALTSFGFPPCPGNIMVRNPIWSQSIDGFIHQIKDWVMSPDDTTAMHLGVFYDAVAVTGRVALLEHAKSTMRSLMQGESAYIARFAKAIDQFDDATASVLSALMATVGVGSGIIHIKKTGIFPIVHGVRVMAIEKGITPTSTGERLAELARLGTLSKALADDLNSALNYFMEVRLKSQIEAIRTGRHEEEAIVRLGKLSAAERDLLRDALKVVKRFKEIVRRHYHLEIF